MVDSSGANSARVTIQSIPSTTTLVCVFQIIPAGVTFTTYNGGNIYLDTQVIEVYATADPAAIDKVANVQTQITTDGSTVLLAPINSPTFTGTVTLGTGVPLIAASTITSSGGGIGYAAGAGGTVTQLSSRTTTVALSKLSGTITMFSAAQAADALVTFTFTNSFIAAGDFLAVQHISTTNGGAWQFSTVCTTGSANISVRNVSGASITEATPLQFFVFKGATT